MFISPPHTISGGASATGGRRGWWLGLILALAFASHAASTSHRHALNIKAAPLADVLREFSLQTGLLLGYLPFDEQMEALPRTALQGRFTADEALTRLLAGSGLSYHWVNGEMLAIGPATPDDGRSTQSALPTVQQVAGASPLVLQEEVIVWSQLLRPFDTDATRLVTLDRERIDEIGAPTLPELLRYVSQSAYTRPEGYRTSGAQYAELRGLGADTTLVLINGRRTFPSANSLSSSAFDLNTVPITAVERVDILLDSASVAHGTDAIGGVVNIVLRERMDEPAVQVRYGEADGGAQQRRATVSGGFNTQRFSSAVVLDAFDLGGLRGWHRQRWRDQDFRRYGGTDQRSLAASPGNIQALPGELLPGLSHDHAVVPQRLLGAVPTLEDYRATAGQQNQRSLFEHWSIVPRSRRLSAMALGSLALNERHRLSAEALLVRREAGFDFLPPSLGGLLVPADNAFNPFGRDVYFHGQLSGLQPQSHRIDSDFLRSALALEGERGRWRWELSAVHSWERARSWLEGVLDGGRLLQAVASDDPAQALNLFGGPMGSAELMQGLLASPQVSRFSSGGAQVAAALSGTVAELPAGPVTALAGMEWRPERARFEQIDGSFQRQVRSGYLQMLMPLLGRDAVIPGVYALSLTAGVRLDDYSDAGRILRPQYGLSWMPHLALTFRVSHGRSLRPPSLYELYLPSASFPLQLIDPARANESVTVMVASGGRSDLRVTGGNSVNVGVAWQPVSAPANISIDYWRLEVDDRLSLLSPDTILANESLFARRVQRQLPSAQDEAQGRPGRLVAIDSSSVNAGWLKTSGIDIALGWESVTSLGTFRPRLEATWVERFLMTDVATEQATDRVGRASMLGSITRWRAMASLGWGYGPYGVSLVARHTPSYADYAEERPTGRNIKAQTLFDVHGTLLLGEQPVSGSWREGLKVTVGVLNALDSEPPFAEINRPAGYDSSHGDLKQRLFYMQLNKAF